MDQAPGVSLQCLGPAEAGGRGPVELYAGLGSLKSAMPQSHAPYGKDQTARDASEGVQHPGYCGHFKSHHFAI